MLALILIWFEGGLELRLKEALRYSPGGLLLAIVSYGFTLGLIALVARATLHMTWFDGALRGAVLGSTSAAVVFPAIQQIDAPEPIRVTLTLESSLVEIIAVLMVGTLMGLNSNDSLVEGLITGFGYHILIDVVIGAGVGVAWSRLWPLVAGQQSFLRSLNHLRSPKIVQVQHAQESSRFVHHRQGSDLLLLHDVERGDGIGVRINRLWLPCHALTRAEIEHFFAVLLEQAPQVAIADDPHQLFTLHDGSHSQTFA